MEKIFETSFRFYTIERTTGKVQYLVSSNFSPLLTNFSSWEEDWTLGYNFMQVVRQPVRQLV